MRLQAEFTKKVKTETIEISLDLENEVLGILGQSRLRQKRHPAVSGRNFTAGQGENTVG